LAQPVYKAFRRQSNELGGGERKGDARSKKGNYLYKHRAMHQRKWGRRFEKTLVKKRKGAPRKTPTDILQT